MKTNTFLDSSLMGLKFLSQKFIIFIFIFNNLSLSGQTETYTKNYTVGSNSYQLILNYQPQSYDEVLLDIDITNTGTTDIEMRDSAIRLVNNNSITFNNFETNGVLSYPTVSLDHVPDGLQYIATLNISLEDSSWIDSKLSSNETVRVSKLALGTGLKTLTSFSDLADLVRFYTSTHVPPLFTDVAVAIQGNDSNAVSVVLENQSTQGQSIEMITSSATISMRNDQEFHVWANDFASGTQLYTSQYTQTSPLVFTPSSTSNSITLPYTSSQADVGSIEYKVTGLPDNISIEAILTSTSQSGVSYQHSIVLGSNLKNDILVSTYRLTLNNYTDTINNIIYTPNYSNSLEVSTGVTTTLMIDFTASQIYPFKVKGFPTYVSHGTITSASPTHDENLKASELDVIFKYSGEGGDGDRGKIPPMFATINTIEQARRLEAFQAPRKIMPLFVHYTANASGGGSKEALKDLGIDLDNDTDINNDNMILHYRNLIQEIKVILSYEDADHLFPGSFIISPDMLGAIQQDVSAGNGTDHNILTRKIDVNDDIRVAFEEEFGVGHINTTSLPSFNDDLKGYFQSINYIIKIIGECKIPFGYQENIWAAGSAHWIYDDAGEFDTAENQATLVSTFLNSLELYTGPWKPDFIVFDRYERDCFGSAGIRDYAFTAKHWNRFLDFCERIAIGIGDVPIMLWQIPGGHMPSTSETLTNYDVAEHSSAAATFFFGDSNIGTNLTNIIPEVRNIPFPTSSRQYGISKTVGDLLVRDNNYDWSTSNLPRVADMNVFSILWGGGQTTGIASIGTNGDGDDGWMARKVNEYYENLVFSTTADPTYQVSCKTPTLEIDAAESSLSLAISLHPNPSNRVINISHPPQIILKKASIYDLNARMLKTFKFTSKGSEKGIDISALANASYVVIIETSEGKVVKYLIKN